MALHPDTKWPPTPEAVRRTHREWAAWWAGNPGQFYGAPGSPDILAHRNRPSQYAGGVVGTASRWFWGPPRGPANSRRLHIPMAADIVSASADLLFGEELAIEWDDSRAADRMDYVLRGLHLTLLEAAETVAALGGGFLRVGWDSDVADHVLISTLSPEDVVPVFRHGRLTEVTFSEVVRRDGERVWRHLETHRPGRIEHELRLGTNDRLGDIAPLPDAQTPEMEALAAVVDADAGLSTGFDGLTVAYVPNVRPYAPWRLDPMGRHLGRSDYGAPGVTGLFDQLDQAWSSWMRDLELGKARLLVAQTLLESNEPGQGASFDMDREVFESVRFAQGQDASLDNLISGQQFAIRVAEHAATVQALKAEIIAACGYSGSTFGLAPGGAEKTATEVISADRRTALTRERKTRYWTGALEQILTAASAVDSAVFGGGSPGVPSVVFPSSAQQGPLELAKTVQALRAAEAISRETAIRLAQPDLDDAQVQAEVDRIAQDTAPPPVSVVGINDDGGL